MTDNHARVPEGSTVVLGEGMLAWPAGERHTDRYGTVYLTSPDGQPVSLSTALAGTYGHLVAVVLVTRRSRHIGDWARGLAPTTPTVGETITLGVGTLFIATLGDPENTVDLLGLTPDDGRPTDWMSPAALYRSHDQTVRLELRPASPATGDGR